jgi:hypothetical protein
MEICMHESKILRRAERYNGKLACYDRSVIEGLSWDISKLALMPLAGLWQLENVNSHTKVVTNYHSVHPFWQ